MLKDLTQIHLEDGVNSVLNTDKESLNLTTQTSVSMEIEKAGTVRKERL